MERLANSEMAFIRPSPAGGSLGGVARRTRESMILCEAAGFHTVLIETVGVGQSETLVHGMVDFFLLLMIAGAGDELQGIKRGIVEMADLLAINKADGDNVRPAERARREFAQALHLFPARESGWTPETVTCSATAGTGISDVWDVVLRHRSQMQAGGWFEQTAASSGKAGCARRCATSCSNSSGTTNRSKPSCRKSKNACAKASSRLCAPPAR